ncbi:hypothetical protein GCA80_22290, partial [Escherichia coli]|nr:hypothetical protein [Escherichia coli]
ICEVLRWYGRHYIKEPNTYWVLFSSISAISRKRYHRSLMCDFLFIVEPGLFIIVLNKANG